ncbi:MAG: nucleotidyltransferase family protein [Candidatus Moraniibacteriota bacterium]
MNTEINLNLIEPILKLNDIKFAGIFGSFARGEANEDSDVDILVRLGKPLSLLGLIRLERTISEKIGREVDLVTEDSLSPIIKEEVLRDLKPIYEKR